MKGQSIATPDYRTFIEHYMEDESFVSEVQRDENYADTIQKALDIFRYFNLNYKKNAFPDF